MSALLQQLVNQPYKHGFVTDIESDVAPKGLSEDTIRMISAKKDEPAWLLDFRLGAYRAWLLMEAPAWPRLHHPPIDFQAISYYAAPRRKPQLKSMDEVDPELLRTFEKLGVPLHERARLRTGDVSAERNRSIKKFAEPRSHRRETQRCIRLTLGPTEMGNQNDLRLGSAQVVQGGQAGPNSAVVGDDPGSVRPVTKRHIEVRTDDNCAPGNLEVVE